MALSGSFISGTTAPYIQVNWNASQNALNNTSDISISIYLLYGVASFLGVTATTTVNGISQYNNCGDIISSDPTIKSTLIGSFHQIVTHDSDGNFSTTIFASAVASAALTIATASSFITLDQIFRYSTINSSTNIIADDETVSLYLPITVYKSTYTHTLSLKDGLTTIFMITGISLATGTLSRTFVLTSEQRTALLEHMTSKQTLVATLSLETFNSGSSIGTSSVTAVCNTYSEHSAPIFTAFTYEDYNTVTATVTGNDQILIKDQSKLKVICSTAIAQNGATIVSYSAVCGYKNASSSTTTLILDKISQSGNITLTVTVKDSRGYITTLTTQITVVDYDGVKITDYTNARLNGVEDTIQVTFEGDISPLIIGEINKNAILVAQFRYKKTIEADTEYSAYVNITLSHEYSSSFDYTNLSLVNLDAAYSWDLQINITDKLTTDTLNIKVPQGQPLVALRSRMIGINNNNPSCALDVIGDISMNGYGILGLKTQTTMDFDQLLNQGIYYFNRAESSAAYSNYHAPVDEPYDGYVLIINITGNEVIQIYFSLFSGDMYKRFGTNSTYWTFGNWALIQ